MICGTMRRLAGHVLGFTPRYLQRPLCSLPQLQRLACRLGTDLKGEGQEEGEQNSTASPPTGAREKTARGSDLCLRSGIAEGTADTRPAS